MCVRNAVHPGSVRTKKSSSECQPSRLLLVTPVERPRIACASSTSCRLRTSQSRTWNSNMGEANAGSIWANLIVLMNAGCSIQEGLAVKRALLFAGEPLLPRFGPVVPARSRREHAGDRRVDEGRRVTEDPFHAEAASK